MKSPSLCGRDGHESSAICDVSNLLKDEDKDSIDLRVGKMWEVEFAIVVIPAMVRQGWTVSVQSEAEIFANTLLQKWGVGDTMNNGVLIFLSIKDRVIFIALGKEIQAKLSSIEVERIIFHVTPLLKSGEYASAIERAIIEINIIITRGMTTLTIQQKQKDNKVYMARIIGPFLRVGIFLLMIIWVQINSNYEKKLKQFRESLRSLILELILPDMKPSSNSFQIHSCSCPVCFELYPLSIYKTSDKSLREILNIPLIDEKNESFEQLVDESAEDNSLLPENYEINLLSLIEFGTKLRQVQLSSPQNQINNSQIRSENIDETNNLLSEEENSNPRHRISSTITTNIIPKINYRNPIYYNCGHIFCSSCSKYLLKEKISNYCPLCEFDSFFIENTNHSAEMQSPLVAATTTTTSQSLPNFKCRDLLYRFQNIVKLYNKFTSIENLNTIQTVLQFGNREESIKLILNLCIEINKAINEIEMKKRHIDDKYKQSNESGRPPNQRNAAHDQKVE